jgi:hypothetical protein
MHYPDITNEDIWPFNMIIAQMAENPDYLKEGVCPYSPEIITFLKHLSSSKRVEGLDMDLEVDIEDIDLEKESLILYQGLKNLATGLTPGEKLQQIKTMTQLQEKLLSIKERATGIAKTAEYHATLLTWMEDICTPDQRTEFIKRYEAVVASGEVK